MKIWLSNLIYGGISLLLGTLAGRFVNPINKFQDIGNAGFIIAIGLLVFWILITLLQVRWNKLQEMKT